jgi:hypothetical protein
VRRKRPNATKLARVLAWLGRKNITILESNKPDIVKALVPPSSFRKTGPGVTASLRRALLEMTKEQRLVARANSWDKGMVNEKGWLR